MWHLYFNVAFLNYISDDLKAVREKSFIPFNTDLHNKGLLLVTGLNWIQPVIMLAAW